MEITYFLHLNFSLSIFWMDRLKYFPQRAIGNQIKLHSQHPHMNIHSKVKTTINLTQKSRFVKQINWKPNWNLIWFQKPHFIDFPYFLSTFLICVFWQKCFMIFLFILFAGKSHLINYMNYDSRFFCAVVVFALTVTIFFSETDLYFICFAIFLLCFMIYWNLIN